jgi:hypothetical protein
VDKVLIFIVLSPWRRAQIRFLALGAGSAEVKGERGWRSKRGVLKSKASGLALEAGSAEVKGERADSAGLRRSKRGVLKSKASGPQKLTNAAGKS